MKMTSESLDQVWWQLGHSVPSTRLSLAPALLVLLGGYFYVPSAQASSSAPTGLTRPSPTSALSFVPLSTMGFVTHAHSKILPTVSFREGSPFILIFLQFISPISQRQRQTQRQAPTAGCAPAIHPQLLPARDLGHMCTWQNQGGLWTQTRIFPCEPALWQQRDHLSFLPAPQNTAGTGTATQ